MQIIYRQSDQLGEFATSFAAAQGQFTVAVKDSKNPHFKSTFASFAALVAACQGPLSANKISRVQRVIHDEDGKQYLETMLIHGGSGQYMSSVVAIGASAAKVQEFGSALTYLKRYTLAAMLGIPQADDDADDDGEGANGRGNNGSGNGNNQRGRDDDRGDRAREPEPPRKPAPIRGVNEIDWRTVKSAGDFTLTQGDNKGKRLSEIGNLAGYRATLEAALVDPEKQAHRDTVMGRIRAVYDLQVSRGEATPLNAREPGADG